MAPLCGGCLLLIVCCLMWVASMVNSVVVILFFLMNLGCLLKIACFVVVVMCSVWFCFGAIGGLRVVYC